MSHSPENQFTRVAAVYDNLMYVVPYAHWVDYVERLWNLFNARPRTVLDLACGTGNVLIELRRRDYLVAGADYSEAMLAEARRKVGPEVGLFSQDMRSLDLDRSFDSCVCLFDSLNYLLGDGELLAAFQGVFRHLNPGGTFVFDMNAVRALELGMFDQRGRGLDGKLFFEWESEYDPETRLCAIHMEYTLAAGEGQQVFHERHVQRGYSLPEIEAGLAAAGFEIEGCFDAFTLDAPTARSDRYHFVARRPREWVLGVGC